MAAAVIGFWPNITEEQLEAQNRFWNDDRVYGDWIAECCICPNVMKSLEELGLAPLLSHTSEGMVEEETNWVSPDELAAAATKLGDLIRIRDPRIAGIVETYSLFANRIHSVEEEMLRDLIDIHAIAMLAKNAGVPQLTLEVHW